MKARAHLKDSNDPIVLGSDIIANCGASVPKAQPVFCLDGQGNLNMRSANTLLICRECVRPGLGHARYIYGLLPGQEAENATEGKGDGA